MSGNPRKITDFWRSREASTPRKSGLLDRPAHIKIGGTKRRKLSPSPASQKQEDVSKVSIDLTDKDEILSQKTSHSSATLTPPESPAQPSSPPAITKPAPGQTDGACDVLPSPSSTRPKQPTASVSFTSLPPSTIPSSTQSFASRRTTTSDGKEVVKDSSSENDTDSSLERCVSSFEKSRINKSKPKSPEIIVRKTPIKHAAIPVQRTTMPPLSDRKPASKAKGRAKMSFAALIADAQQGKEADARFRDQQSEHQHDLQNDEASDQRLDLVKATALIAEDETENDEISAERVRRAIERTEALQTEEVWYMFRRTPSQIRRREFPANCLPPLLKPLKDRRLRKIPGEWDLLVEGASLTELPPILTDWLAAEVCLEPSDELVERYIRCLVATATKSRLDISICDQMLQRLGVLEGVLEPGHEMKLTEEEVEGADFEQMLQDLHRKIGRVVNLFRRIGSNLRHEDRSRILHYLLLMRLDHNINQDSLLTTQIGDAIESICNGLSNMDLDETLDYLEQGLSKSTLLVKLRHGLLSAFNCTSPRLHYFRRRLAFATGLQFEFDDGLPNDFSAMSIAEKVLQRLDEPGFRVGRTTDYATLTVRLDSLDIAIDSGFADLSFALKDGTGSSARSPIDADASDDSASTQINGVDAKDPFTTVAGNQLSRSFSDAGDLIASCNAQIANEMRSSGANLSKSTTDLHAISRPRNQKILTDTEKGRKIAEKAYNKQLRHLADRLREIAGRIRITGATNLKGTEAQGTAKLAAIRLEGLMTKSVDTMDVFDKRKRQSDLSMFLMNEHAIG